MNKDEVIEAIISDDMDTIHSGEADDYLYNLLKDGMSGYANFTDGELKAEYQKRLDPADSVKFSF